MSLLKSPPREPIRSLDETLAVAYAMEREAATRYAEFAAQARADGVPLLADLFEGLAADERGHEAAVTQWAQQRSGSAPDLANIRWELPETFDTETTREIATSKLASAYRILSIAVRNEERAFAFWSYVAADTEVPEVRAAAERMALEELDHVARLRRARREAYRQERREGRRQSPVARLAAAAALELHLASQLDQAAATLPEEDKARASEFAAEARAMAAEADAMAGEGTGAPAEFGISAAAERLVEDYLDVADLSRDEDLTNRTQSLARRAIMRLAWTRSLRLS